MGVNTTSPKPRRPNERERLQETDSFVVHPEDPTTLRAKRHTERERLLSENADSDSDSSPSPAKTSKKREPPAKKKKQEQDEESGKTKKKIVETGIIKMVAIFGSEKAKTKALSKKPEMEETLAKYKEFYSEIKTEFDKAVDAELAEEFTHWFQEEDQYIPKDSKHTMEKCPVNLVHENSSIFWDKPETDDDGAMNRKNKHKKHQVSHTRIECGDLLPPMNYYVPIEQSINTKDQLRLTHMPYFCDGQADENLFDKLVDVFPDGIHGFSDNYGYVNDWLVYKLLRKALEAESTPTCPDIIYYNIYRVWPNKLTQRELSVEFPKLCERFAEEKLDPRVLEPWKPHAEQEVALNIRNLDCYSCLSYMCPIHGFKAELPPDFPSGDFYQVTVPLLKPNDTNFCSSKCWKHVKLSKVADVLKPTEEEVRNFKVTMYMDKARLIKMPAEDGALLASIYGAESKIPFCKFAADNVDPHDDDEENKIRSCRDAYELIISLVERPSESRLKLTRPAKQMRFYSVAVLLRASSIP
uniref:Uncharacterized protein n=2 Tax=Caenorhabditis japonica TaxID=281687 RepID=A0A8R1DXY3_CAEJA